MNSTTPLPWPEISVGEKTATPFRSFFEHAPIAVARCNSEGTILEMNPAFEQTLDSAIDRRSLLRLRELVHPEEREKTDLLLRDLINAKRNAFRIEAENPGAPQPGAKWTAWRQAGLAGEPGYALLVAQPTTEPANPIPPSSESILQTHRWETIGRLTGGVVHDFNNLLTGVMLYCDLLLSSLDGRDCRRRYADEIRGAVVQATGLVRQLLACVRPQTDAARLVDLNEIAEGMRDLLARLVGENITLELRLDPGLGAIKIDPAQAQQILLNLVLNARDALPEGGNITVETGNCGFHPVAGTTSQSFLSAFPCALLTVADNGRGMTAETHRRLFDPFFTTKSAPEGGGLGLTTVRSIVTSNHGLIHFESEAGLGTRAMILFPRSAQTADSDALSVDSPDSNVPSSNSFQEVKKESQL